MTTSSYEQTNQINLQWRTQFCENGSRKLQNFKSVQPGAHNALSNRYSNWFRVCIKKSHALTADRSPKTQTDASKSLHSIRLSDAGSAAADKSIMSATEYTTHASTAVERSVSSS